MDIICPECKTSLKVGEKHHYKMIKCPKCGKEFQVVGRETVQLTREYLDKLKEKKEKEQDS